MISVRTLKLMIAGLDDNTPVLIIGDPTTYREPQASVKPVVKEGEWPYQYSRIRPGHAEPQVTALILS
jgi:hypothetical protein